MFGIAEVLRRIRKSFVNGDIVREEDIWIMKVLIGHEERKLTLTSLYREVKVNKEILKFSKIKNDFVWI
jgi:hypothetical protein